MSKLALTNLANLQNETTAVNAINNNNAAIIAAMENTLSRNGALPNPMLATLDMNSNHIINLPAPTTPNEPLREQDLIDFLGDGHLTVNNYGIIEFDTRAEAISASIALAQDTTRINGYNSFGDGGGALYKRVPTEPTHAGKFQSSDGAWWEIAEIEINVLQFGATGDGTTNDTTAIQNAVNYVQNSSNLSSRKLRFPSRTTGSATYRITNLVTNGVVTLCGDGPQHSIIKALAGGNNNYLIAQAAYVGNGAYSDPPIKIENLAIDGNAIKDNVIVFHGYDCELYDCYVYNCTPTTGTNLLISSLAIDGTTDGGGGSGLIIARNYFGYGLDTAGYQIRVKNPSFSYTDVMIFDNTLQTANYGLYVPRPDGWMAGWQICRNHFFLCNTYDLYGFRSGISTTISENYFESNVKIETVNISVGPNNTFYNNTVNGRLDVFFPEDNAPFHSSGNNFGNAGYINHFGTTANHKIFSKNDNFNIALAYRWGTLASASTSKIYAINSYNHNTDKIMNGMATGVTGETTNGPFYDGVYINDSMVINGASITAIRGIADTTALQKADGSFSFIAAGPTDVTVNPATTLVVTNAKAAALQDTNGVSYLSADTSGASLDGDIINLRNRAKTLNMLQLTATGSIFNSASPPVLSGSTSGTIRLVSTAIAGTNTITFPAATGTLVLDNSTNTFTNKTFDTAGTGNSFSINGVAVTGNSGTGLIARQNTPSFITPSLGDAIANTVNKVTITAPATSATLTIANGKTLTVNNSITLTGTDSAVYTFPTATATLPAYVQGSWTPSFVGSSTPGTGQTYSTQFGTYEQIGRVVIARFDIAATSLGTAAGNLLIGLTGLPTPATTSGEIGGGTITFYSVSGLAASNFGLVVNINGSASTTTGSIFQNGSSTNAFLTVAQAGSAPTIAGYFVYRT